MIKERVFGTVSLLTLKRSYEFITRNDSHEDAFFHRTAIATGLKVGEDKSLNL